LKTSDEIADSISQNIAHIYLRPSMHVGATAAPYSANSLDNLLYALHYQWAFAHDRADEFRQIVFTQHKTAGCENFGFADAFRRILKKDGDEDASRFVMRNWREISKSLEIPLDNGSSGNAIDAKL